MSHHGFEKFEDGPEKMADFLREMEKASSQFRGPVGAYPDGMLSKSDEGSIQFAVAEKDGKVVLDFGSPVAWIGMTPQQAMDIASAITKRARSVAANNGETVHFTIGG